MVFEVVKAEDRLYICLQLAFNIVNPDSVLAMSHGVNEACMHPPRYSDSISPVATGDAHDGFYSCRRSDIFETLIRVEYLACPAV